MPTEPNQDYQRRTDNSLLGQWMAGDDRAAAEVFARHSPRLLAAARSRLARFLSTRLDPEDIVQSTFKSFFRRAGNGGYLAPESGDLFNLLIVIAMRKVSAQADFHRAAIRDARRTVHSTGDYASGKGPAEQASSRASSGWESSTDHEQPLRELCLTIDDLCQPLTELQQKIVALRLEGFSVAEIAAQCARSKRTVERELQSFRALISLQFEP